MFVEVKEKYQKALDEFSTVLGLISVFAEALDIPESQIAEELDGLIQEQFPNLSIGEG